MQTVNFTSKWEQMVITKTHTIARLIYKHDTGSICVTRHTAVIQWYGGFLCCWQTTTMTFTVDVFRQQFIQAWMKAKHNKLRIQYSNVSGKRLKLSCTKHIDIYLAVYNKSYLWCNQTQLIVSYHTRSKRMLSLFQNSLTLLEKTQLVNYNWV